MHDATTVNLESTMQTGVWPVYLLSPIIFIVTLDWVMDMTAKDYNTGIQWNLAEQLEVLHLADDIVLLSQNIG